jgi:hypothetical protein
MKNLKDRQSFYIGHDTGIKSSFLCLVKVILFHRFFLSPVKLLFIRIYTFSFFYISIAARNKTGYIKGPFGFVIRKPLIVNLKSTPNLTGFEIRSSQYYLTSVTQNL